MGLLLWLLFGAVVGGVAKWLVPGRCPDGWLPTIALGVVGSFVGGLPFGSNPAGLIGSVVGAVVCLFLFSIWSDDYR
jgi:uncharacterized membrane protein YeaQ/YmgE (transglycosylase-associated protein family)